MAPRGGLREVDQAQLSKHPVGILAQRSGVFCNWSISFHIVRSPLSLVLRHAVLCWLDGTVFTDHFVNVSPHLSDYGHPRMLTIRRSYAAWLSPSGGRTPADRLWSFTMYKARFVRVHTRDQGTVHGTLC